MAYNKLRKLLGMKPKADKTTSEKGITTVTDYFPDFSVKEVAEYREDGSQLSVSRYSKGQISEKTDYLVDGGQTFSLYSDGVLTEQTTTRADGEKTVTAFAKGKKTERTTYHPDGRRTVDSFENGKQTGTTDHYPDGSKIISTFSDDFSYQTKINADGSIDYKDRLCSRGGKPITRAFSRESRKTAYINVYVNGFKLGETIGLGHAYKPEQEAESVRQNTLYNAANRAIAKGDGDELEAVTAPGSETKGTVGQSAVSKPAEFLLCSNQSRRFRQRRQKISGGISQTAGSKRLSAAATARAGKFLFRQNARQPGNGKKRRQRTNPGNRKPGNAQRRKNPANAVCRIR